MSIFSSAPLLSGFRTKGGTFFTLSSAVRDTALLLSNGDIKLAFSKFACLKLPNWENETSQSMFYNGANLQPAITDPNNVLPKAFIQNYVENLIQYAEGSKTNENFSNFGEAAFWKALRNPKFGSDPVTTNAEPLQFNNVVDRIVFDETLGANVSVYKEKANAVNYERVVKYVGDVNMINHVKSNGSEYTEVYVHLPTEAGYQEDILFYPNVNVLFNSAQIPSTGGDPDSVVGLEDFKGTNQVEPIYDTNDFKYNVNADIDKVGIWFDDLEANANKWNKGDFEFNCVLLYYDLFDKNDITTKQRNLWGVLFLDRFQVSGGGFTIAPLKKYMPDAIQPGNAFGFRFNLKFSAQTNQVTSEITINDYNTISMELYLDALSRLRTVTDKYASLEKIITEQQSQIQELYQIITTDWNSISTGSTLINTLNQRVQSLESSRDRSADVRISPEDLYRLFQRLSQQLADGGNGLIINNRIIMTAKALLPKVVDKSLIILEDENGVQYQWDAVSQDWIIL